VTVVFFVSGHGFGHAARQVEVINTLAHQAPGARILIYSAVSEDLLRRTVTVPYDLRRGPCDSGIVQATSVSHDDDATVRAAVEFYERFDERVSRTTATLAADRVALVVGDSPPLAFAVASRLGVPSLAIANFTWDWIYETHPGLATAAPWLIDRIRAAYAQATLALELPFSGGFTVFPRVRPLPLIARHATRSVGETRAHFGIPSERPAVLLSFGGYGLPDVDLTAVDCRGDWTIVTTDRSLRRGAPAPGVVLVEETGLVGTGFRYEDLVTAVDVVLTKPGYGIIAECVAADTAMLYTSRGHFREYDVLVRDLPRVLRSRFISQADLFGGRWREALDALRAQPAPPEHPATNGAALAAAEITRVLAESR
jgi:hypothetical protein